MIFIFDILYYIIIICVSHTFQLINIFLINNTDIFENYIYLYIIKKKYIYIHSAKMIGSDYVLEAHNIYHTSEVCCIYVVLYLILNIYVSFTIYIL